MPRKRHIPERSCVACGNKIPKRELVRIVRSPQGEVSVDLGGKAPGRGAYLCAENACWTLALSRGRLSRSLGAALSGETMAALRAYAAERAALVPTAESNQ